MVQHSPARSIPVAGRSRAIDIPVRRLGVRRVKFFDLAGNPQMAELAADYIEAREARIDAKRYQSNTVMHSLHPHIAAAYGDPLLISTDETSGGFRAAPSL